MPNSPFKQQAARRRRPNRVMTGQPHRQLRRLSKQDEHDQRVREEGVLAEVADAEGTRKLFARNFTHGIWLNQLLQ